MEIYYGSRGISNYIESKTDGSNTEILKKNYYFKMLENNDIEGLIKPVISMVDSDMYLRYSINSYFVLKKYFLKSKPDIACVENIINSICSSISDMEKYLLNPNDLILSPEYMLWDDNEKTIKLICAPFYDKDIRLQLKKLMEYIMQIFDYKSPEGTVKMHNIYEVTVKENFDIGELEKMVLRHDLKNDFHQGVCRNICYESKVDSVSNETGKSGKEAVDLKILNEPEAEIIEQGHTHENALTINLIVSIVLMLGYIFTNKGKTCLVLFVVSLIALVINLVLYYLKKDKEDEIDADESMREFERDKLIQAREFSFEERDYFNKSETESKIKSDYGYKKEYKLVPLNDGMLEPIVIDTGKKEIVIGRGKNDTDYRLNKEQISRIHAKISVKNNNIFIEDKNSTNGTFVNSVKLEANEQIRVNAGDIIRLANEEFFVA
ncbi:MAG: FHA domain-containing protein [Lachnospiraceae bacterium]|nr:FHA domain-containing protein [Lachnospiraceae bacterium]